MTVLHCAVLPPSMLSMLPHQLRDLLQWHIRTHNDHLVSAAACCAVPSHNTADVIYVCTACLSPPFGPWYAWCTTQLGRVH